ncbi:MAG TPA: hypothetical protein VJ385_17645 [Fibrobacteria bacterium]|nr:hypothetical protein [Fibrobacteria bacterium]
MKHSLILLIAATVMLFQNPALAEGKEEITILRQVYIQGKAEVIKDDEDVQNRITPYRTTLPIKSLIESKVGKTPAECGLKLLNVFLDSVRSRFSVGGAGNCGSPDRLENSKVSISCATTYLNGYDRIFILLAYEYLENSYVKLVLEARQRSAEGIVFSAEPLLKPSDQEWLSKMYQVLTAELKGKV